MIKTLESNEAKKNLNNLINKHQGAAIKVGLFWKNKIQL